MCYFDYFVGNTSHVRQDLTLIKKIRLLTCICIGWAKLPTTIWFWETMNLTSCSASQCSWPVGLWAQAHGCPVSTRVGHGEIIWRIVTAEYGIRAKSGSWYDVAHMWGGVLELLHMWDKIPHRLNSGLLTCIYIGWANLLTTIWFWETMNLTKCMCNSTLLTRRFVGPNPWMVHVQKRGTRWDYMMDCHGLKYLCIKLYSSKN